VSSWKQTTAQGLAIANERSWSLLGFLMMKKSLFFLCGPHIFCILKVIKKYGMSEIALD
jgi:hypothetical protein